MPTRSQTITLANDISELSRIVKLVDEFCTGLAATEADIAALHLVLEEIAINVIRHGYRDGAAHSFDVSIETSGTNRVRATVTDDAPAFEPFAIPAVSTRLPLEERPVGGLGVHLVRRLMDVCLYERRDGRNVFMVERKLRCATPPANIAVSKSGSSAMLALRGRLDGLSSPEVEQQVSALIKAGIRTLVFDLSGLEYVSSAGLRVFIVAAKAMKQAAGSAQFKGLSAVVRGVFDVAGLLGALEITDAPSAAPPA